MNKPKIKKIKQTVFPKDMVKVANERLRKLEVVNRLAMSSEAYKSVERFATDPNSKSNKFYREVTNKDGSPGIRFMTPGQYKQLTEYEKRQFNEVVENFINSRTSYKTGIEVVRKENYDKFMENHPYLSWTYDEYSEFFSAYDQAQKDKEDLVAYGVLTQIFNARTDFSENLTAEKIEELLTYNSNEIRYSNKPTRGTLTNNKYMRGSKNTKRKRK